MNRQDQYEWHVSLNQYNLGKHGPGEFLGWMYEAKRLAEESPRLALLFRAEREGKLRKVHQQCSMSAPEPVIDNKLRCCLGKICRECPHLKALESTKASPETIDEIKAWTCAGHILMTQGLDRMNVDTSEGFILTEDDRMFWQRTYASMSQDCPDEEETK